MQTRRLTARRRSNEGLRIRSPGRQSESADVPALDTLSGTVSKKRVLNSVLHARELITQSNAIGTIDQDEVVFHQQIDVCLCLRSRLHLIEVFSVRGINQNSFMLQVRLMKALYIAVS